MARSILIEGVSYPVRLGNFSLVESARNGEVGQGGFDIDSENAGFDINPHWDVRIRETDAGSNDIFVGYMGDRDIARGPFATGADRQFDFDLVDLNTLLGDRILRGSANRPAETDIARVTWLSTTGSGGAFTFNIGATGAKNMDAADYRGRYMRDVLSDCAEMAGKLFFAYWDPDTDQRKLFYDLATASNYNSPYAISTTLAEVDSTSVFAPRNISRRLDGGRIYSGVEVRYNGGKVMVQDTAVSSNYRRRETSIYDDRIKTAAKARARAEKFIAASAAEEEVISCEVDVTSSQILHFRTGQRVSVKAPHLGIPSPVYRRIVHREVKPRGGGDAPDSQDYTLALELSNPKTVRWSNFGTPAPENDASSGGSSPTPDPPGPVSECGITDTYTRVIATPLLPSSSAALGISDSGHSYLYTTDSTVGAVCEVTNGRMHLKGGDLGSDPGFPAHYAGQTTWLQSVLSVDNSGVLTIEPVNVTGVPFCALDLGYADLELTSDITGSGGGEGVRLIRGTGGGQVVTAAYDWTAGTDYFIRWEDNATLSRARIWLTSAVEPTTWLITNSNTTGLSHNDDMTFTLAINNVARNEVYIDNLDILGVNRCFDGLYDNFDRTEASGWGTSSSGYLWTVSGSGGSTTSVTPRYGRATLVAFGQRGFTTPTDGPWSEDGFSITFQFRSSDVGTAVSAPSIGWADGGNSIFWGVVLDDTTTFGIVYVANSVDTSSYDKTNWLPNTWYQARMEFIPNQTARIKVWVLGEVEPSAWQASVASGGPVDTALTLTISASDVATNIDITNIDFGSAGLVIGTPVQGEVVGTGDGATVAFTTGYPYRPGSLQVYVDNLLEPNVTETDPTTGAFTFDSAPFDTETITVFYQAAGV